MKAQEIEEFLHPLKQDIDMCIYYVRKGKDKEYNERLGRVVDRVLMLLSETDEAYSRTYVVDKEE